MKRERRTRERNRETDLMLADIDDADRVVDADAVLRYHLSQIAVALKASNGAVVMIYFASLRFALFSFTLPRSILPHSTAAPQQGQLSGFKW